MSNHANEYTTKYVTYISIDPKVVEESLRQIITLLTRIARETERKGESDA